MCTDIRVYNHTKTYIHALSPLPDVLHSGPFLLAVVIDTMTECKLAEGQKDTITRSTEGHT